MHSFIWGIVQKDECQAMNGFLLVLGLCMIFIFLLANLSKHSNLSTIIYVALVIFKVFFKLGNSSKHTAF